MSFTDGNPWIATKTDCEAPWGGGYKGKYFRCTLCGYKFQEGDTVRMQYTNDIAGAGGNPLVCIKCDGTKEKIANTMKQMYEDIKTKYWWFVKE